MGHVFRAVYCDRPPASARVECYVKLPDGFSQRMFVIGVRPPQLSGMCCIYFAEREEEKNKQNSLEPEMGDG